MASAAKNRIRLVLGVCENEYMPWNTATTAKRKKNDGGRAGFLVRDLLFLSVASGLLMLLLL